jgi:CRP/FNR family transcriptional regulator
MLDNDKFMLIRNYDLWCHLDDREYEELNIIHRFVEAKKGDYIYFDSHHLNKIYFVKNGHIKIGYIDEKGDEIIKEIIQQGELFGQFSLEKNNLNGEFARAYKADVSLCAFSIEDFEKLLNKRPDLAVKYTKMVGKKLRKAEFRLIYMLNKDVRSRLLAFFYNLIIMEGYDGTQSRFSIENFLTHEDIAKLIGSARQTVTGFINQLEKEGILEFTRKKILVHQPKKLENAVLVT